MDWDGLTTREKRQADYYSPPGKAGSGYAISVEMSCPRLISIILF